MRLVWFMGMLSLLGSGVVFAEKVVHGEVVKAGPGACPAVALTYDLCPVRTPPGLDAELIEFLATREIPATFFMSGKWMTRHDAAVKQLLAVPSFEVGTHGYVHAHLPVHDIEFQMREIAEPVALLKSRYGHDAKLFRPPYGEFNDATLEAVKSLGLRFIMWSIESGDPDPTLSADAILARIKKRLKPGSIIVLHANGKGYHTKQVTEDLITTVLPARGLRPMTISDLLSCQPAD
ncbi:MAG TPA: polysaccharide deacetylase family protein [Nitrospiraceae bacterium]|nr:polysaccharide deacetylase family protein [Nitrospiraceae bacterium]